MSLSTKTEACRLGFLLTSSVHFAIVKLGSTFHNPRPQSQRNVTAQFLVMKTLRLRNRSRLPLWRGYRIASLRLSYGD
jgi:hypothetical protein